jgi:hypothetical protein
METPNVEHWKVTRFRLSIFIVHQIYLCQTRGWRLKRSDCWKSRFWKLFALSVCTMIGVTRLTRSTGCRCQCTIPS